MTRNEVNGSRLLCAITLVCSAAAVSAQTAPATGAGTVVGGFTRWEGDLGYTRDTAFPVEWVRVNGNDVQNNLPNVPISPTDGVRRGQIDLSKGTTSVSWQYKIPDAVPFTANLISFQGATFNGIAVGQAFKLGTFTVTNGVWFESADADLTVTTSSDQRAFNGKSFSDTLRYVVTTNRSSNTPDQNADYVYFVNRPELGEIRVYEAFDSPTGSNTGSIELWGKIGSLTPLEFRNAQGGVFAKSFAQPVPEPSTWAMTVIGLLAVGAVVRRGRAAT